MSKSAKEKHKMKAKELFLRFLKTDFSWGFWASTKRKPESARSHTESQREQESAKKEQECAEERPWIKFQTQKAKEEPEVAEKGGP